MKISIDHTTKRARFKMSEEEYQQLKIDADKRGMSVEEMMQADLDARAPKMFPEAFRKNQ